MPDYTITTEADIDKLLKGTVKLVTKDYVIYKRDWLGEHIDQEAELIKSYAQYKETFNQIEQSEEQFKKCDKKVSCEDCFSSNQCKFYLNLIQKKIKKVIETHERYKNFKLVEPTPLKDLYAGQDFDIIQFHTILGDSCITGFCGQCSWKDGMLESLDGDSYYANTIVYAESKFQTDEGENCVDILVNEW